MGVAGSHPARGSASDQVRSKRQPLGTISEGLAWSGPIEFDLDQPRLRMHYYRIVLTEVLHDNLVHYLDRDLLISMSPTLRTPSTHRGAGLLCRRPGPRRDGRQTARALPGGRSGAASVSRLGRAYLATGRVRAAPSPVMVDSDQRPVGPRRGPEGSAVLRVRPVGALNLTHQVGDGSSGALRHPGAAKTCTVYLPLTATPVSVSAQLTMLARWPELPIQSSTIFLASVEPQAMFSAVGPAL